ncbi:MAG: chemotaxis protein CheX [Acidimicrobiia bacterium]|nr:chemotaxis protein CheX [Acidimicrobiia bacterium]
MQHEDLVSHITQVTQDVFCTMLGQSTSVVQVKMENGGTGEACGVAALVGIAGGWQGTGIISCSSNLACKLASQMLTTEYVSVNDDVLDAMGEIANIVVGNIKTNLEEKLGILALSIPTVVHGKNFATRSLGKHDWTIVEFDCDGNHFLVQMMLIENTKHAVTPRGGFAALHRVS